MPNTKWHFPLEINNYSECIERSNLTLEQCNFTDEYGKTLTGTTALRTCTRAITQLLDELCYEF